MKAKFRFPIRFKILIALLLVVTIVVGLITFTMAKLFHTDKSAYIHDLTSEMATHTAAEMRALLTGYSEQLQVFTRVLFESGLNPNQKSKLLKQLFEDFREFVAITLYEDGKELTTVYDAKTLEKFGLTKDALLAYYDKHPIPFARIDKGRLFAANSTLTDKMPTFTLAVTLQENGRAVSGMTAAAVIRLDGLQRLAERSKVFTTFIADYRGNLLAHTDLQQIVKRRPVTWVRTIKGIQNRRVHGTTLEYTDKGEAMVGGLAQIEISDLIAGVEIPKAAAYLTARELLNSLIIVSFALLILSAVLSLFGSRLITRRLEHLSKATEIVAKGQFNVKLEASSSDEIGELADSFNKMASELDSREKALQDAQSALVQSEKMAAFGQLGAGIAHEIKNPLAGILGLAQLTKRKMNKNEPAYKNMEIIEKETNRCTTIIQNLLKFARQEKVDYGPVDLNQVARDAMAIVEHQLEMNKVKLSADLMENLPIISGNANQIQQVLINLMINAQQAMDGSRGEVTVSSLAGGNGHVELKVSDNGPGMPEEVRAKIFEPFFTTKPVGKGTGLGLSVSYGIIQEHKGEIRVDSRLDEGTTFAMTFPVGEMKSSCPGCRKVFPIQPNHIGLKNKCKNCGTVFEIKALAG
jgi:signal transduction histidine kinase